MNLYHNSKGTVKPIAEKTFKPEGVLQRMEEYYLKTIAGVQLV